MHTLLVITFCVAVVPHRGPGVTIRLQSRPGMPLEAVQDLVDLLRGRLVVRRPGDNRLSESMQEW